MKHGNGESEMRSLRVMPSRRTPDGFRRLPDLLSEYRDLPVIPQHDVGAQQLPLTEEQKS